VVDQERRPGVAAQVAQAAQGERVARLRLGVDGVVDGRAEHGEAHRDDGGLLPIGRGEMAHRGPAELATKGSLNCGDDDIIH